MTNHLNNTAKRTARLAGVLYLLLIPFGYFGVTYIPTTLEVSGDMAATVSNIAASESMYRLSMASTFIMNIVSIVLVLVLYKLLKPVGKNTAVYMIVFLLLGAGISMLNEINHFAALALSGIDPAALFTTEQSQYFVRLFLDMHEYGSYIAAIFWGLWLFPLGHLISKSNFLPKILGVLLIIAGIGYVLDSFIIFLVPHYGIPNITNYTFIGEITIMLWLLIKGVDDIQWKKLVLEAIPT